MSKINLKVRVKNPTFWVAFIPALLLLGEQVLGVANVHIDTTQLENQLLGIAATVFALLAILGIVVDPTTTGITDSERAQGYEEPQ